MVANRGYVRKEYTVAQCAYLAGIIDGEGCIYIGNHSCNPVSGNKHFQTTIQVTSTSMKLIQWLTDNFGGHTRRYTRNQMAENCRKPAYTWYATGDRVTHICEIILPYMTEKSEEVQIML